MHFVNVKFMSTKLSHKEQKSYCSSIFLLQPSNLFSRTFGGLFVARIVKHFMQKGGKKKYVYGAISLRLTLLPLFLIGTDIFKMLVKNSVDIQVSPDGKL